MKTKIVLIGAGSASFSLALLRDAILSEGLQGSCMTLVDIDEKRLDVAYKLAVRYARAANADIQFDKTMDRVEGMKGADFVICAVKIGGYEGLEAERAIAESRGYYRGVGDRVSCYYGGIGAYHHFRFLLDLAHDMEKVCPDAWLVQTANPVFEGTNLVTRYTSIKAVGVCHGHWGYKRLARRLGLDPEAVTAHMAGFNHCIYLTHFYHEGKDAYPLIDEWIENETEAYWASEEYNRPGTPWKVEQMSPGAVNAYRLYGIFPIGDAVRAASPWWHHSDLEAKQKWYGTDGGFDSEIGWNLYLSQKPKIQIELEGLADDESVDLVQRLPLEKSGEQHITFIDAVLNDRETLLQLNIPNSRAIKGTPNGVFVEVPTLVNRRGPQTVHVGQLPPLLMQHVIIPRWMRMEIIMHAFTHRDRRSLVLWLAEDPRTQSYEQARDLVDELLAQDWNKDVDGHYK